MTTTARADSMPKTTAARDAVNAMLKVQEDVCRLEERRQYRDSVSGERRQDGLT